MDAGTLFEGVIATPKSRVGEAALLLFGVPGMLLFGVVILLFGCVCFLESANFAAFSRSLAAINTDI